MKVKDFLNACDHFATVTVRQITTNLPAFDPEEDTESILHTNTMREIPDHILTATIELWSMSEGNIEICI